MKSSCFWNVLGKIITVNDFNPLRFNGYNYSIFRSIFFPVFSMIYVSCIHPILILRVPNIQNLAFDNIACHAPVYKVNFQTYFLMSFKFTGFESLNKKYKLI